MKNKIVLAYSGGLDTSYCVRHFTHDKGMEVHAVLANNGGFSQDEVADIKERALFLGAASFTEVDITEEYYEKCIKYMIYGNIKRMDTYPLSVSSERMFQALAIARYANRHKIWHVAHGSTGAGNDQVRFDLVFKTLIPGVVIHTPIRDQKLSRQFEIDQLKEAGLKWDSEKSIYSINKGIWGTSIGGKETLTSHLPLPDEAYPSQPVREQPLKLTIGFDKGAPISLNGESCQSSIELIQKLNELGSEFAIGRDIHVGDTIIGIKGRVAFEAAAALIVIDAHTLLEKHVLTKHQIYWKKQLADWYGMMLHEGNYMEPSMRWIESFLDESQEFVTGEVYLTLYPYRFTLDGIQSDNDLMSVGSGVYGEENKAWTSDDAKGFIHMMSIPLQNYYQLHQEKLEE